MKFIVSSSVLLKNLMNINTDQRNSEKPKPDLIEWAKIIVPAIQAILVTLITVMGSIAVAWLANHH